jgi:gliding motility-associatede transport system auxiliary component
VAARQSEVKSGFSVDSLRIPLIGLGLFALFAGLITGLIGGLPVLFGNIGIPNILFAVGVLLLGIYVALDPEDVWARLTGRSVLYSGNAVLIGAAALVILGLLNVLASRYETKADLTANKQFTLSEQSIRVAQAVPQPVHITAWLQNSDSRRQDFQTLLDNYVSKSNGQLSYEVIDPDVRAADARAAGITAIPTIVYQMGDKKQESSGTAESDVSTALVKLERPIKKIYFTTGHGERSLDGSGSTDYSQLKAALEKDNFTVSTLSLLTQRAVPDDAAEVVIGGPTTPFLQEEKDALKAYLDGGGKLVALIGPGSQTDLNDLLQPYQVGVTGNVIVDPVMSAPQDPRIVAVNTYSTHAITKNMGQLLTFYPLATSLTAPTGQNANGITVLASSSDQSWGSMNLQQPNHQDSDPKGPLPLVVAVDTGATSGTAATSSSGNHARIVLIGSPDLVANNSVQQVPGNQSLFLDSADWVAQQDSVIDIRPPDTTPRTMTLIGWQMNLVWVSSILLLPLALLAAGAAVWWARR